MTVPDFTPLPRSSTERVQLIATPSPTKGKGKGYDYLLDEAKRVQSFEFPARSSASEEPRSQATSESMIYSYLPTTNPSKSTPVKSKPGLGLPVPPGYKQRSVATPPPAERPRAQPHKDLVDLTHVEEQRKERERREIKRLIDLNHVEFPSVVKDKERERKMRENQIALGVGSAGVRRERKTSVKALVGAFEQLDDSVRSNSSSGSSRPGSSSSVRNVSGGAKTAWRP